MPITSNVILRPSALTFFNHKKMVINLCTFLRHFIPNYYKASKAIVR